jgi:hypothetical protein
MRKLAVTLSTVAIASVASQPRVQATDTAHWYCGALVVDYYDNNLFGAHFHGDQWPVADATKRQDYTGLRTHHETYAEWHEQHAGHTSCE